MAPVYADHPFQLLHTPMYELPKGEEPDMFARLASEMVMVHNILFRGANAIYLQAPHIKPEDQPAFAQFMLQWYRLIHYHHRGEEKYFFPEVVKMTGEAGLMEKNLAQHEAFHDGIDEFGAYAKALIAGQEKYDGKKVVAIFDSFRPAFEQHLNDEIPSILALRKFGEETIKPLEKVFAKEAEEAMGQMGLVEGLPWCLAHQDAEYEDGLMVTPPGLVPTIILGIVRNFTWWLHTDWWKFGACDRNGRMRPLYAVPDQE